MTASDAISDESGSSALPPRRLDAIFINSVHPATRHVAAVRLATFAASLARFGHRIVLLTPVEDERTDAPPLHEVRDALRHHDWSRPFLVTYKPARSRLLEIVRANRLPSPARRLLTALLFALKGTAHGDRVAGSRTTWPLLIDEFSPNLILGSFGDTANLEIARQLARRARVPWIMDIKDNWAAFLRPGVRELMAFRFRNAAAFTSNANFHGEIASRWNRQPNAVVYSGVAHEMMASPHAGVDRERFVLTLIGSIRKLDSMARFLAPLDRWLAGLSAEDLARIEFVYAGADVKIVEGALVHTPLRCATRLIAYIPLVELGRLCSTAAVNCYIWADDTFHHKLLELMACRRPAISFPGEHEESIGLVRSIGGELLACTNEEMLVQAFDRLFREWKSGGGRVLPIDVSNLGWDSFAKRLETFMLETLDRTMPDSN